MKQELREELNQLVRDWQAWAATVSISLPGIIALLLRVQGNPEVLLVSLVIFLLLLDGSSSLYILLAKKKEQSIYIATRGGQREKSVAKYRLLQPYAKVSLLCSILIAIVFMGIRPINGPFTDVIWGTRTPTPTLTPVPTQTLTLTPSPTITLTPSPRPLSDSLYYMIVYDSSRTMDESFHGQKKWQVALNLLIELMNGLNTRAQYSIVTIGGPNSPDEADACNNPGSLALQFSPRKAAYDYLVGLRPQGVGSFYRAYTLAKNQLEDLPRDTIRTLIYITGSDDTCETEDEWTAIKNLAALPDSTFGIYSQIIILDDDGIRSQTLAERFNRLSNSNINAQAPQSISEIQGTGVTLIRIVNNVNVYIDREIATREPEAVKSPTPSILSTNTITSGVIPTVSLPTLTLLPPTAVPPTAIPPTPIPPTATPQLPEVLYITGPSDGASLGCAKSEDCMITVTVQWISDIQASAQGLSLSVWVKPYPGDTGYLFSSQTEVRYLGNGLWQSSPVYIGQKDVDEPGTPFAIYAIITNQPYATNQHLSPLPPHTKEFSIEIAR